MAGRLGARENPKDVLSRSIMENMESRTGNTSIMDINSGFKMAPQRGDMANLSMSCGKPIERSFISKQETSFFSRKKTMEFKNEMADDKSPTKKDAKKEVKKQPSSDSDSGMDSDGEVQVL
jgi:hypothetical protein